MLEIKKITKVYETEGFKQKALDQVSINFRENEFASILGPSGSGKTTLLNIIGGLDHYTKGDLVINGISTKKYKDSDWDTYRNHRVGFVFQGYHLISHQSILSNVELALTLSGVNKKQRRKKAIDVLKKVGLKDHLHKKPNQLSGGQMQRVAIARALINDPDILLADEPTGALDTETSTQIMNLLKEIAEQKLVIMVTHNPELANKYSTRIIKLLDGHILDDTNPYEEEQVKESEEKSKKKSKKTSMSFFTALSLSLNNLMTKKGRTILTAFAGSIGIIGIALILSLSSGVQNYINRVQEDTLSSYPLAIEKASIDYSSMMQAMSSKSKEINHELDKVYSNNIMTGMIEMMGSGIKTNDLRNFKTYINEHPNKFEPYVNDIKYSYDITLNLYKKTENSFAQVSPVSVFEKLGFQENMTQMQLSNDPDAAVWNELTDNKGLLKSQYEILAGVMPEKYNEVVLILDENNEISDYALYGIGLKDQQELTRILYSAIQGNPYEPEDTSYSYDEILNTTFKLVFQTDYYQKENGSWINKQMDPTYMNSLLEQAEEIKIVGIIKAKEDANIGHTTGSMGYHSSLTNYLIERGNNSEIIKEQVANPTIDVFTGRPFEGESSYEKNAAILGLVDIENPSKIQLYPKDFDSKDALEQAIKEYNKDKNENEKITYTDYVGLLMSSVTTIVDIISYVLIAFVSISLIVSSIMIGIITYISVLERTKEIGILRAIGASKKDISRVFNAETFIIGLLAGILGILITVLLNIPINIVIKDLTGISNITKLPALGAILLVIISMTLTLIAGLIPSRMASKKDPVEALRTE